MSVLAQDGDIIQVALKIDLWKLKIKISPLKRPIWRKHKQIHRQSVLAVKDILWLFLKF